MFHASFRARHCLVLADSFYEWKTLEDGRKQPYRIMLKSSEPFAMAGIYARDRDHQIGNAENTTATFAILTTAANELNATNPRANARHPPARPREELAATELFRHVRLPAIPVRADDRLPRHPKMNKASFNQPEAILPPRTRDTMRLCRPQKTSL